MITGKIVCILFMLLCMYFFCDGYKNPDKYKAFSLTLDGDLYPMGAIVDPINEEFYVAEACLDAGLVNDCHDVAKSLKVKISKREVESCIREHDIQSVEEFIAKIFEKE
tara:strand:- start:10085 stop:10411 length:327 start_codon:yes stop_codon:yes gene_type:complete